MDVEHYSSRPAADGPTSWTDLKALDERGAPTPGIPTDSIRGHLANALSAVQLLDQDASRAAHAVTSDRPQQARALMDFVSETAWRVAARLRGVLAALNDVGLGDDRLALPDVIAAAWRRGLETGRQRAARQYLAADIRARQLRDAVAGFLTAWDAFVADPFDGVGWGHVRGCAQALRAEVTDPEGGTVGPAEFAGMVREALDDADAESEPDTTGEAAAEEFAENGAVKVRAAAVGAVVGVILRRFPGAFGGIELSRGDGDWVDVVSLW